MAEDWFSQNAPASSGSYNLNQAVQKIQQSTGKTLTESDISGLLAKFGGDRSSTFTDAGLAPVIASLGGNNTNYGNPTTPPDTYHSNPDAPRYEPLPTPEGLAKPYVAQSWRGGDYVDPAKPASLQSEYRLPTQAELEASPGYESRRAAGQLGKERSAAAQGTVLNGGTQKALSRYNQDYASNEYGNMVGQTLAARTQNVSEYNSDASRAFQGYSSRYGQFLDKENLTLGTRQQNVGEFNTAQNVNQGTFNNRYKTYQDENARTLNDYLTNVKGRRDFTSDYWSRLNDLYQGGNNAATGSYRAPL